MRPSRLRIGLCGLAIASIGILLGYRIGASQTSALEEGLLVGVAILTVFALVPGLLGRAQPKAPPDHAAGPDGSWEQFRRELDRSRRFGRSFVIGRIPAGSARAQGSSRTPDARLATLPLRLRSIDQIWYSRGTAYILLPETDREGMRALFHRLQAAAPGLVADGIAIAQFPDDGLTTGSLLARMRREPLVADAADELALAPDLKAS